MNKKQKTSPRKKTTKRDLEQPRRKNLRKRNIFIMLSCVIVIVVIAAFIVYRLNNRNGRAVVEHGYAVSGTVSYGGSQPSGRVYMELNDASGVSTGLGTSIDSPGSYIIHNVPTGTYTLFAWMDNSNPQTEVQNALSPSVSVTLNVNTVNVSGQNISLADPNPAPSPTPPTSIGIAPGNGSVLIQWSTPQDDSGNIIAAQYYNVYYSTSTSVSPQNGAKKTIQASNNVFIDGLTDGTTYYFIVTAVLGGVESSASTPAVSATIGEPTGSNTISGAISFPVSPTGPLYVGVSGQNGAFFQRIDQEASPQTYSISGVPNGDYVIFAILDMNNNGVTDTGDLSKTNNNPSGGNSVISVSGDMDGVNQTLFGGNILARVITLHLNSTSSPGKEIYALQFELNDNLKLPVKVALISGPNLAPTDMSEVNNFYRLYQAVKAIPKKGDVYVFAVDYSDRTSEKIKMVVTDVLNSFAQNLIAGGTNHNVPTFNWSPPASPPADYTYLIQLGQQSVGQEWTYPRNGNGMPSSQTSVLFNVDGSSSLSSLQSGTPYDWLICVTDSNGNEAICDTTYTP